MARYLFAGSPADIVISPPGSDNVLRFAPGATLTVWDSGEAGSQITDLLAPDSSALSVLTSSVSGRVPRFFGPDGVTQLWVESGDTARYILVSTDLGDVVNTKMDIGAPPTAHQHALADIPTLGRQQSLEVATFNTETNSWPERPDTLGPVLWTGDAERPAADVAVWGLDYVDQLPVTGTAGGTSGGSTNVPDPPPVVTEDPDPVTGIALSTPVVAVNGASISVSADLTTSSSKTFAYAQIAVRGPQNQGLDTGFKQNVTVDGVLHLTGTKDAPVSGTYTAFATYNASGGSDQTNWVDGPTVTFTVTLPTSSDPVPGGVPLVGLSGHTWNSGGYHSNDVNNSFGTWRGKPLDGSMAFVTRSGWDQMFTIPSSWTSHSGILIIAIPPQPSGQNDSATAAGSNNQRFKDYGTALHNAGLDKNTTIIRVWENNLPGDWRLPSNSPDSFQSAIKNMSTSIKATAPNIKMCVNWNRGNGSGTSSATWQQIMQALMGTGASGRYVDLIGIDSYDWYPGQVNSGQWNSALNQNPNLNSIAAFARSNGIQMTVEEWACIDASGGSAGGGGGDNPYYIQQMHDWFAANDDVLAFEEYYDDQGAPSTLHHQLSDGSKPSAATRYKQLFGTV